MLQKDVERSIVMKYEQSKLISTGKQWDWEILEIDSNSILQVELRYKIFKMITLENEYFLLHMAARNAQSI